MTRLTLGVPGATGTPPTSVSLFDQGLVQILEAAVTGLAPRTAYVLGLASPGGGGGALEPLAAFTTNAAGAAIVNATGPIRALVRAADPQQRRVLVIARGVPGAIGAPLQVQRIGREGGAR